MKTYYLLFLAFFFTSCASVKVMQFEEITEYVEVQDTKENLFVKSNLWLVDAFNDAEAVTQYSDKEAGVIAGKYVIDSSGLNSMYNLKAVIKIFIQNNRARISIYPLPFTGYTGYGSTSDRFKDAVIKDVQNLIENYEYYISKTKVL